MGRKFEQKRKAKINKKQIKAYISQSLYRMGVTRIVPTVRNRFNCMYTQLANMMP